MMQFKQQCSSSLTSFLKLGHLKSPWTILHVASFPVCPHYYNDLQSLFQSEFRRFIGNPCFSFDHYCLVTTPCHIGRGTPHLLCSTNFLIQWLASVNPPGSIQRNNAATLPQRASVEQCPLRHSNNRSASMFLLPSTCSITSRNGKEDCLGKNLS